MCHALLAGVMAFTLGSCGGGGGSSHSTDKGIAPNQFLPNGYASCEVTVSIPNGKDPIELSFTCENLNNATQGLISKASAKNIPNISISSDRGVWNQTAPTTFNRLNGMNLTCERMEIEGMTVDIYARTPVTGTMKELEGRTIGGALIVHYVTGDAAGSDKDKTWSLDNSIVKITYTPVKNDGKPSGGTEASQ